MPLRRLRCKTKPANSLTREDLFLVPLRAGDPGFGCTEAYQIRKRGSVPAQCKSPTGANPFCNEFIPVL